MTPPRPARDARAAERANEEAIGERRFRAVSEPLDPRLRAETPYPQVDVRNPVRGTEYLVVFPLYPARAPALCTCTDFARRGLGDCKHIEAAWRWLPRHADAPGPAGPKDPTTPPAAALWAEIDRRVGGPPPLAARTVRELATAGRVLFER